jgi:restriction system protein
MARAGAVRHDSGSSKVARRKSRNSLQPFDANVLAPIGVLAFVGAIVVNNFAETIAILLTGLGTFGVFIYLKKRKALLDEHALCLRIQTAFKQHEKSLVSYYNQSRRHDLFGNIDDKRWQSHIDRFLQRQVVPDVENYKSWRASSVGSKTAGVIDRLTAKSVERLRQENSLERVAVSDLTPLEYEHHCAELIRKTGWEAIVTPAARDGGVDIIAKSENIRLVIQCKKYTKPVGNKAVQEVNSAVRLNGGTVACVVAPSGFTRQAQMEAEGLGIHLLHHSDLPAFVDQISRNARLSSAR